ncbi:MAG: homocysteine S-methyltransferase family protein, partial [Chloroflexota bacterium]
LVGSGLPVQGLLANCCAPESIAAAMPALLAAGMRWTGGYANTFEPVPEGWSLTDDDPAARSLTLRQDLDPAAYLEHARGWRAAGATVVGGCCGTRPAHIAAIAAAFRGD